jgi:transglutaminase-like putative cysteine protease
MLTLPILLIALAAPPSPDSPGPDRARSRDFDLTYRATVRNIPAGTGTLDIWLPLPQTDRHQTIHRLTIDSPAPPTIGREARFGNQSLHVRIPSPRGAVSIGWTAQATRRENGGTLEPLDDDERALDLAPEPLVPLSGPVRELAEQATAGRATDAAKARAIYDRVTAMLRYDKSGTGWGRGDALFACDARRGNCTDFHALAIGMARSAGIPARFAIGLPLPEARASVETEIQGYHCWAELYVDGRGWVPIDASEAVKHSDRREYFFGHHDENRLELSRGRNLTLSPAQHGPALNFFVDPYAEVDGRPHRAVDRRVTFRDRIGPDGSVPAGL